MPGCSYRGSQIHSGENSAEDKGGFSYGSFGSLHLASLRNSGNQTERQRTLPTTAQKQSSDEGFCYSGWLQHEHPRIYCEEQTAMGSWRLWINDICFHLDHLFCRGLGCIQGDLDQSLQWKSGQLLPVSQKFSCFQMRDVPVQGGGRQFLSKATLRHQGKWEKYRFPADF